MQGQSPARTRKLSLSVAEHTTALLKKQVETGRGSRVVNRSNNNANTNGGVAYVNTNNAPSHTNANIGSRLANRKNFKRVVSQDEKDAGHGY